MNLIRYVFGHIYSIMGHGDPIIATWLYMGYMLGSSLAMICVTISACSEGRIHLFKPLLYIAIIPTLIFLLIIYLRIIRHKTYKTFIHDAKFNTGRSKWIAHMLILSPFAIVGLCLLFWETARHYFGITHDPYLYFW